MSVKNKLSTGRDDEFSESVASEFLCVVVQVGVEFTPGKKFFFSKKVFNFCFMAKAKQLK